MSIARSGRIRITRTKSKSRRPSLSSSRSIRNASGLAKPDLDYHYDYAPHDLAARVFRTHIAAARQSGLPLVIHARDADADVAAILEDEMGKGAFKAVLHCFTSSRRLAEIGLALGFYVSFSGVLTFKKSDDLRAIARDVPDDRLLVETDAPYLAPVPYRGKRNEPAFVAETAKILAEVKGVSAAALAADDERQCLAAFRQNAGARRGGRAMSLTVTILGCGSSGGVPRVGQGWGSCDPKNPKNWRRRCSILVERSAARRRQHASPGRYVAGSTQPIARLRRQTARRNPAHPFAC